MNKDDRMNPLVTVYIPTFNRLPLLQRSVNSVLDQSYKNIELFVVDDSSDDGTSDYLAECASRDSRIVFRSNTSNLGGGGCRNVAIQAAKGEFITGLDDDDYFTNCRIEAFLAAWANRRPDTKALFTSVLKKCDVGVFLPDKKIAHVSQRDLLYSNYLGSQVFVPTEVLRKSGGFDPSFPAWQDLDCWYRLLAEGEAERLDNESYIVDVSHEHDRISKDALKRVNTSFSNFCQKYDLGFRESVRLSCQKTSYSPSLIRYMRNIVSALMIADFRLFRMSIVRLKKNIVGKIHT